jgi:hypothetical protein
MTIASFGTSRAPSIARRAVLAVFNVAVSFAVVVLIIVAVVRTAFTGRTA